MLRRLFAVAPALLALSGCLPSRNNAQDPKNLPTPEMQILAVAPGSDGCKPEPPELFTVGHAFPRSWCIYLDARDTIDADRYRFTIGTSGTLIADGEDDFILLDRELLFSLTVGEAYTITLDARNGGNGVASTSQPFLVQNQAPVAIAGPSVTLPVNGFPWSLYTSFTVPFTDGGSYDPDGDAISYCWTFDGTGEPGGSTTACSDNPADAAFTRLVPTAAGITRGYLTVSDGAAESLPSRLEVFVGDPILWAALGGSGTASLVDGERRKVRDSVNGTRTVRWASRFDVAGQEPRVAVVERRTVADEDWLMLLDDRGPEIQGEVLLGEAFSSAWVASDEANARIWTMRDDFASDQYLIEAFDVIDNGNGTATITPRFAQPVTMPYSIEGSDDVYSYSHVDESTGTLWFTPPFLDRVARVSPDGVSDILTFPGRRVGSAAIRPGTSEGWVADSPDFVNDVTGSSRLSVFADAAATVPDRGWDLPGQFLHSMQWISEDQFWIADSSLGVVLLDAKMLDEGFSVEESTLVRAGSLTSVIYLGADPVTGDAFGFDVFGISSHVIRTDGTVEDLPADSIPLFADRYGVVWQLDGSNDLLRSRDMHSTGIVRTLSVFSEEQPSVDPVTGGIWTYSQFPSSIQHLAPDGRKLRIIEKVDAGSGPVALTSFKQIRASFDGTWAVARLYSPADVSWLDFSTDPPVQSMLPDPATGFTLAARPSSPANSSRFIWTLTSAGEVYKVPIPYAGASLPAPVLTFPERARGANVMAQIAPSMEDGSLCLITVEDDVDPTVGSSTVRLRRISAAGAVTSLITTVAAPSTFLEIGTASTGFGVDAACWIVLSDLRAGQEDTVLAGVLGSMTFVNAPFSDPARNALSFSATTNDTIWMSMQDPVTLETSFLRADWDGMAWVQTSLAPLDQAMRMSAPNSTVVNGGGDEFSP